MSTASFCDDCGAILPLPAGAASVTCRICRHKTDMSGNLDTEVTFVIPFNPLDVYTRGREPTAAAGDDTASAAAAGPLAEKQCPRCGNPEMSYATAQLRSADEGQTIFYTCPKCGYKFSENS